VVFNVLKNPNPLKDVEASALLDVAELVQAISISIFIKVKCFSN